MDVARCPRGPRGEAIVRLAMTVATAAALLVGVPDHAHAQKPDCLILCTPKIVAQPGLVVTSAFEQPEVRMLATNEVVELESETHFVMIISAQIPTTIPRTTLFTQVQWMPFAGTGSNPFTGYTADELGEDEVRDNPFVYELGASFTALKTAETDGWLALSAIVADQIGPAAEPDDAAIYTHKLIFSGNATISIFNWLPKDNWLSNVAAYTALDYVATGLPDTGDEVPDGARVFLDDASPWSWYAGVSLPIAPLEPGS